MTLFPQPKVWEPRLNRDHELTSHLLEAIKRWHHKRMSGKAYTYPKIEAWRDPSRSRTDIYVSWEEADLPPDYEGERFIYNIPPGGGDAK